VENELLFNIALVVGLGMFAQWIAWRLRQPSIMFLLILGLIVGPGMAAFRGEPLLDVEHFLGELLFPVVSASVAIILFEGGLSLRFRDIRGTVGVLGKLMSVGVIVTWLLTTIASMFLLGLSLELSLLLGATLVVTGPTVIIPMLKQIRPKGRVGSILRWEGIIIDPVGAILAVLVFEEIISGPNPAALGFAIIKTLLIGIGLGWIVAQFMVVIYRRYWVPDTLQNPITLAFVVAAFAASNIFQPESGLLTVTVMGIVMANQKDFDIRHIVDFKETLQVLLLSSLFILLSARMQPEDFQQIGIPTLIFVAIIIFITRPLSAWLSTMGSDLSRNERIFLAWMAPRGIVAASVASIFTLELVDRGFEEASILLPVTFAVVIGTVATYSLTASPLARWLGLAERNPQGLLIVGATAWVRFVAKEVQQAGFRVILADTNPSHVEWAQKDGLEFYRGSILSEAAADEINFGGIGRLLAMTTNSEVNALASEQYKNTFGSHNVFELQRSNGGKREGISQRLGGRTLFPVSTTYNILDRRFQKGARVMTVVIDDVQAAQNAVPNSLVPLFVIADDENLVIWTEHDSPVLRKGQRVIALVESEFYDDLLEQKAIQPSMDDFNTIVFPALEASGDADSV
jgi:NhaP-type Na+/H+ or K+/H+ antiporter